MGTSEAAVQAPSQARAVLLWHWGL